jgi:peptidoglycan/xylan/chitin deacetylase (PgdA/CDA1 family)
LTREIEVTMSTQPRDRYEPFFDEIARWVLDHGLAAPGQLRTPEAIPWSEVAALSREEAVRFESHGVTHTALVALDVAALRRELEASRRRVSEHTRSDCRHFCYPYGGAESLGAIAPGIVPEYYDTAVTMSRGRLQGARWSVAPRIPVYAQDSPEIARLKILAV